MDKVSCLMLTLDRLEHFERSLRCFCNQDYPEKELVVVTAGTQEYVGRLGELIASSGVTNVRLVLSPAGMPLGALRNLSVRYATGPLVCQWDDDDLNDACRVSIQVERMLLAKAPASFLSDQFHFFCDKGAIYWCDWTRSRTHIGIPGTLLAYKHILPRYDDALTQGEDSDVQWQLYNKGIRPAILKGYGYLNVYKYHGFNIFPRSHHEGLVRAYGVEAATLRANEVLIRNALDRYAITQVLSIRDNMDIEIFRWGGQSGL